MPTIDQYASHYARLQMIINCNKSAYFVFKMRVFNPKWTKVGLSKYAS